MHPERADGYGSRSDNPAGTAGHPTGGYGAPGSPAPGYAAPGYPAPGYPAPGYPAPGHAGPAGPQSSQPGPYDTPGQPLPYGTPGEPGSDSLGRTSPSLQVSPGTALVIVGGLLYFVGSFLAFLSFDLREVCSAVPAEVSADCFAQVPNKTLTASGWNSTLVQISAVLMLVVVLLSLARAVGALRSVAWLDPLAAGLVGLAALFTVVVLGFMDAVGLSAALAVDLFDELAAETGVTIDDVPLPGLGVGGWLCVVALVLALGGVLLTRVQARGAVR